MQLLGVGGNEGVLTRVLLGSCFIFYGCRRGLLDLALVLALEEELLALVLAQELQLARVDGSPADIIS